MYPILFRLDGLVVYAYGFFIAIGFIAGLIFSVLKARKEEIPFERVVDLFFYSILSAFLGSRILFALVNFDLFRENPLKIFKLWEGGLVFYGGLILAIGVAYGYIRRHRLSFWKLADLFSPAIALGLFFGRLGCFFAGCCYGKETSLPWGIMFTDPNSLGRLNVRLHPVQLYEASISLTLFFFLSWMGKKKTFDGQIFCLFLLLYSIVRFFIEIMRDDPRGFFVRDFLSTSQGVGIFLIISSIFMLIYLKRRR